jgi:hypothetical protein
MALIAKRKDRIEFAPELRASFAVVVPVGSVTSAPTPSAISPRRPLNVPLFKHSTRRPGQHVLDTAISIAADPGPARPMIFVLLVWNA